MWQDQGRQYHMWFGHGTAPTKEKPLPAKVDPIFKDGNASLRIEAVAHCAMMHMPRKDWHRAAVGFDRQRLDHLRSAMTAWIGASHLSDAEFTERLLTPSIGDAAVRQLRAAAEGAQVAATH